MAAYFYSVVRVLLTQFIMASVSSRVFPNHKYPIEGDYSPDQNTNKSNFEYKKPFRLEDSVMRTSDRRTRISSQLSIYPAEASANELTPKFQNAERKITKFDDTVKLRKSSALKNFENSVTPKGEYSGKNGYEVTTSQYEDTELESPLTPSALGLDNDVAIALDDDDIDHGIQSVKPEHLNPLVYLDSYGRLHDQSGESARGYGEGYGYGVLHARKPPRPLYTRKKSTGRVRMQVFRGPTRVVGHRKYAPWGYFVVQPANNHLPHSYHYPYIYS